jgi:putative transposase
MLRFFYRRGMVFIDGQVRWELLRMLPNNKFQLESDSGELLNLTNAELLSRWMSQAWVIDESTLASLKDAVYLTTPRDLGTYSETQQHGAKRRLNYLQAVEPESGPYNVDRWRSLIAVAAERIGDPTPPCPSTVSNWWRKYRRTKSVISLVPHSTISAGPRRKRQHEIFEDVVASVYLTRQKLPVTAVVEEISRRVRALNNGLPAEEQIKPPGRGTIYRWMEYLRVDLVDAKRHGVEMARLKYRASIGTVKVGRILERIEIDHTPFDLIVIDSLTKLPLGRPWLTLAIDTYSRMVVGFYISFNAPSGHGVLQCLRRCILPKDEWLARFPDIKGEWPAHGIMELIAVDNGMDLHSDALEAACQEMGIQILFCGSKTPQHKGAIERFFRTMNMGLIHRLPGTVFSSVDQRGDYPAEEKAVIDMETLMHLLTKWVVEVYNVTKHRGIGARPIDRWRESADKRIIELPVYPQQMEIISGIPAKRTLFHYGIELDGIQYNSELLQSIRRRSGENRPVTLKYYEDTVGHVHVYDPFDKIYIEVPAKLAEYADGLPRDIHRLVREHARKRFGDHCLSAQLLEARAEIEALVQQALTNKKMGYRKMGAGFLQHDSETVLRGKDALAKARRPMRKAKELPPSELPPGLDDDLPEFPRPEQEG